MELNLTGKRAVITGASKGIGLTVAHTLAAEGCDVTLVSRSEDALQNACDTIQAQTGRKANLLALDLSLASSIETVREECADVDIVVNNAGAIPGGQLTDVDEATWRAAWDLKVFGYINMTREFYNIMRARGHGVIVNVIGLAGEKFDFGYIAGTTGNASLMAFTKGVGSRSLDDGIRVLAVNPGPVDTDRIRTLMEKRATDDHGDPSRWREYFDNLPLKRPATTQECADLVTFLASDRASYLSGIVVPVDGGLAARN